MTSNVTEGAEEAVLRDTAEQARSLHIIIGKLEAFASLVQDQLDGADWATRRDVVRTLVRRIEVDGPHVRVVFRVDPGSESDPTSPRVLPNCPARGGILA